MLSFQPEVLTTREAEYLFLRPGTKDFKRTRERPRLRRLQDFDPTLKTAVSVSDKWSDISHVYRLKSGGPSHATQNINNHSQP